MKGYDAALRRVMQLAGELPEVGRAYPPLGRDELAQLGSEVRRRYAVALPSEFGELLTRCDGLSFNERMIHGSSDRTRPDSHGRPITVLQSLVAVNDALRTDAGFDAALVLATDAFCHYGLNVADGRYAQWGIVTLEEEADFADFDAMMNHVLQGALEAGQGLRG